MVFLFTTFFEKEVLGVYLSGHPLEADAARWRKNITAVTTDFLLDEETKRTRVRDGQQIARQKEQSDRR